MLRIAGPMCLILVAIQQTAAVEIDLKELWGSIMTCGQEFNISLGELEKLKNQELVESENGSCFGACFMEKMGWMTEDGELDQDSAFKLAQKMFKGDEDKLQMASDGAKKCKAEVDAANVTDKCQKANMVWRCVKDNTKLV